MHKRTSALFEDAFEAIRKSIDKTGGTKLRDKVNERIGRLKQRCGSIHRDYDIHLEYKDDKVSSITWTHNDKKLAERTESAGKYIVQTTLKGYREQQIREYYNIIRRIEAEFEVLKSDLDIRPIFHLTDEAVKKILI